MTQLFTKLINLIEYISKHFYHLLNGIINSTNYKSYLASLFILIFVVLIILINLTNVSGKSVQILLLSISGILLSIFYFFVYRNEFSIKGKGTIAFPGELRKYDYYENRKIVTGNKFDSINFKKTVSIPIINLLKFMGFLVGTIVGLVLLMVFIWYSYQENEYLYKLTKIALGIAIMISVGSIIIKTFSITLDNCADNKNILIRLLCLIKNTVLFLPCMLVLMVDELNKDIKATPNSTFILLTILLILVLSFMGIPLLFKFVTSLNKHDLLGGKGPYYLNTRRIIGKYQDFDKNNKYNLAETPKKSSSYALFKEDQEQDFNIKVSSGYFGKDKFKYTYTYSVSFYLYLNPQPQNTSLAYNKETELFNYGNKPIILYDGRNRNLVIKSKTQMGEGSQFDTIYKTKNIKYQKWMFITINYKDNTIDVFIDGKLVGSKNNVPPYFDDDKITIGEDNGIHGSIKDIYYYDTPRPASNIEFIHDLTINNKNEEPIYLKTNGKLKLK
tara:strand:+ start:5713 stop:7215 length:1503 start_codon:yes stop_codon:yes gene_type:complete